MTHAFSKISNLVESQLPDFVVSDYRSFVAFIEAYYEYLEQSGKLVHTMNNLQNYINVDYVIDNNLIDFIDQFQKQYLRGIPKNVLTDKGKLIQYIKQFYSSRGTEKSFKFLFRILFNEDVDLFNTGTQVLRASDGKWSQPSVIRISTANTLTDWSGIPIRGVSSFASAVVDTATVNFQENFQYNELTLNNIEKNFLPNEIITGTTVSGNVLYGTILSVVPSITILSRGSKYNVGDLVIITGGGGANANAFISEVSSGSLLAIGVENGGSGFEVWPDFSVNIFGSTTPTNARITSVDLTGTRQPINYKIGTTSITPNANIANLAIAVNNTLNYTTYGNTGPIKLVHVVDGGSNFNTAPVITVTANSYIGSTNTTIKDYGTIGTFKIIDGGVNYAVGDPVKIINITSRGAGGEGKVTTVDGNGVITGVIASLPSITGRANVTSGSNNVIGNGTLFTTELLANNDTSYPGSGTYIFLNGERKRVNSITNNTFLRVDTNFSSTATNKIISLDGFMVGGMGYLQSDFPNGVYTSITSLSGSNAYIQVESILGDGAKLVPVGSVYGQIQSITMSNFGDGYTSAPSVDLTQIGDGLATAKANFIGGIFRYPGVFLNEDGLLSSRRYLQDSFRYNSYSYTLKSPIAVSSYYDLVYQILNPVGSNMIGITQIYSSTNIIDIDIGYDKFVNPSNTILLDINFILDISILS